MPFRVSFVFVEQDHEAICVDGIGFSGDFLDDGMFDGWGRDRGEGGGI